MHQRMLETVERVRQLRVPLPCILYGFDIILVHVCGVLLAGSLFRGGLFDQVEAVVRRIALHVVLLLLGRRGGQAITLGHSGCSALFLYSGAVQRPEA